MPATIADVAREAGVSTATVSRVLSGTQAARPLTRERVLAAARDLDYRPSAVARALKLRETRTLGLLVTDIENPFYPQLVRAIEAEAHERGYGIVLCNTANDPARELAYLDLLVERRVDGIIIASTRAMRRHAASLARRGVPVVLVNGSGGSTLASFETAHRHGARMAAEHLLELGHRRIGHIGAPPENAAASLRLAGIRDALGRAGLDAAALPVVEGDSHVDGGARAAGTLVAEHGVTGIVCYNDLTAIGALRALRESGRQVPDDVSIVGFDDIEMATWTDPPLTTVRQPTDEIGRLAVERLTSAQADGAGRTRTTRLEPTLVVRGSTAPPPKATPRP